MSVDITSRPYKVGAACERCVFGSGPHAEWCPVYLVELREAVDIFVEMTRDEMDFMDCIKNGFDVSVIH